MQTTVRQCDEHDLALLRAAWATPGDVHGAHYRKHVEGIGTYLVAWVDTTPLGSAMVQWQGPVGPNARSVRPQDVEINHLQVRAQYRGAGVGSELVVAAEGLAVARERTSAGLSDGVDNAAAKRLYGRLGYEPTGIVDSSAYDWVDDHGLIHAASETNEYLAKRLEPVTEPTTVQQSRPLPADRAPRWWHP